MKLFKKSSLTQGVALIFLFMILCRLTWMQLRADPIHNSGILNTHLLNFWELKNEVLRSWNFDVLVTLFCSMACMMRLITRSWIITLFSLTVLMSRGSLLVRLGWASFDLTFSMLLVVWFTFLAHYLRTASRLSLYAMQLCLFFGSLLEFSFCLLGLTLPLYRLAISRYFVLSEASPRGGVLTTLKVPYGFWWLSQKFPVRNAETRVDLLSFSFIFIFSGILHLKSQLPQMYLMPVPRFIDLHYLASLLAIVILSLRKKSLGVWLKKDEILLFHQKFFLVSMMLVSVGFMLIHFNKPVLYYGLALWAEPLVICLGCGSFFYIVLELKFHAESFISKRRVSRPLD